MKKILFLMLPLLILCSCSDDQKSEKKDPCDSCATWQQCAPGGDTCVAKAGMCGTDADCAGATDGKTDCDTTTNTCVAPNTFDCNSCDSSYQKCNDESTACVLLDGKCNTKDDCKDAAKPVCDSTHTCVAGCSYNSDSCSGDTPLCDLNTGVCVASESCTVDVAISTDSYNFESNEGTTGYGKTYDPGNNGCGNLFKQGAPGNDLAFTVDLKKGDYLIANLGTALGGDALLYLMSNCNDQNSCMAAVDAGSSDEGEKLTYSTTRDGQFLLVIDTAFADYPLTYFDLELTIHRAATACSTDSCTEANSSCIADETGAAKCVCDSGYTEKEGKCVADTVCDPNPCEGAYGGKTNCVDNNGSAECTCHDGYFLKDDICVPNNPCEPTNPCTDTNKTVCSVDGESYSCGCDAGFMDDGSGNCVKGETCAADIEELTLNTTVTNDDGTSGLENSYDPGPNSCLGSDWAAGEDTIYKFDLNAGDQITVTVESTYGTDLSAYILDSCDTANISCVAGSDSSDNSSDPETFNYTASTAGTYYLVIDAFSINADPFTITTAVTSAK